MRPEAFFITIAFSIASSFCTSVATAQAAMPKPVPYIAFDSGAAMWNEDYGMDTSHASDGIVSLSCSSEGPLRLIVEKQGEMTYYALPNDGTCVSIPLTRGNGVYMVSVMEHVEGTSYRYAWKVPVEVQMEEPFAPYRHAGIYVPYEEDDVCVKTAGKLKEKSRNTDALIKNVEHYVEENVEYDHGYVPTVLADHVIDPDGTLASGRGICLDQAALVTAMLRSQGVPAKLIFGNVNWDGEPVYHAWTLAWNGQDWILLDACMPDDKQDESLYEMTQWF